MSINYICITVSGPASFIREELADPIPHVDPVRVSIFHEHPGRVVSPLIFPRPQTEHFWVVGVEVGLLSETANQFCDTYTREYSV